MSEHPIQDQLSIQSIGNSSVENRMYTKDSFDRFDDDLSGLILSYFPIKDRIKYECLSHHWKRSVYQRVNRQTFSYGFDRELEKKLFSNIQLERGYPALESLLRKCPNITEIFVLSLSLRLQTLGFCL